ncbi:MAG: SusC/RagA family TonB-linked outer membrane protein [Gemmatimonadaceae bacterium]
MPFETYVRLLVICTVTGSTALGAQAEQHRTLTGDVTDERGTPVAGAQVTIAGTLLGTQTDVIGRFRITGVADSTVTVRAMRIGFRPTSVTAERGVASVTIKLQSVPLNLDQVVVTGTAGGTQRRAVGNAIASIEASKVVETGVVSDVAQLLNGRAPGVVVHSGSGAAGSGSSIKIRGRGSIALSSDPIVYVDGIRIESTVGVGTSNDANRGARGDIVGRMSDINPDDIENVEVIKGPAAATLYGTEASNGVILITTKRGRSGATALDVTTRQGVAWERDIENRWPTSYAKDPKTGLIVTQNLAQTEAARGTPLFNTGRVQGYALGLSGASGAAYRYYLSADHDRDEGAKVGNFANRNSARASLTLTPQPSLQITGNVLLSNGGTVAPGGNELPAYPTSRPLEQDSIGRGTRERIPPEITRATWDAYTDYDRYTGGLTLNHSPTDWFTQRITMGRDVTHDNSENIFYRLAPDLARFYSATAAGGSKFVRARDVTFNTFDYGATFKHGLRDGLASETSVGGQFYSKQYVIATRYGQTFPVPSVTAIDATTNQSTTDDVIENRTAGAYVQEQLGLRDRAFLTAAVRMDKNSAFGRSFHAVVYPKFSATWVISEEPFWHLGAVNALKLRAAWGASGRQPDAYAALRAYSPILSPNGTPAVTPQFIGNQNLKPERGEEMELGFDASMLANRMNFEFTYYDKRTRDALIQRDVAPSSGYSSGSGILGGLQWVNGGSLQNRGIEAMVNGKLIERPGLEWNSTFSMSTNSNKVISLPPGVDFIAVDYLQNRFQPGYPAAAYFRKHIVSAQLDPNGRAINVMCDDGKGGSVTCDKASPVFRGRADPNVEGAFTNSVRVFGRLSLQAVVDFKQGNRLWNVNRWARCVFDLACEENVSPQKFDPRLIAEYQLGGGVDYIWNTIEDASYVKLREVSATYTLPDRFARRLGAHGAQISIAGRNLHTWTKYTGLDPEGAVLSHHNLQEEDNTVPPLTQLITTFKLTF